LCLLCAPLLSTADIVYHKDARKTAPLPVPPAPKHSRQRVSDPRASSFHAAPNEVATIFALLAIPVLECVVIVIRSRLCTCRTGGPC